MLKKKKKNKQEDTDTGYPICGIVDNIQALHEKYIKLFIDLHTHNSVVDADFYLMAQQALTRQYEAELTIAIEEAQEKTNERFYLAYGYTEGMRIDTYRRWFKHYNTPAKAILDVRINNEVNGRLQELQEGLEPEDEEDGEQEEQKEIEKTIDLIKESVPKFGRKRFEARTEKLFDMLRAEFDAQKSPKTVERCEADEQTAIVKESVADAPKAPEEEESGGDKEILPEDENSLDELYELGNEDENETDADGVNTETESETGNGAEPQSEEDSEVQDDPEEQEGGEEDD